MDFLKRYFSGCKVSWTKEENFHITLWFLGDVSEPVIQKIIERAEPALSAFSPFEFHMGFGGAFPYNKKPKVLWLAPDEGAQYFVALRRGLEEALSMLPVERDNKKFSPHLTLGRARALSSDFQWGIVYDEKQGAAVSLNHPFTQRAVEVVLYQSELHPSGAVHTALKKFPLQANTA